MVIKISWYDYWLGKTKDTLGAESLRSSWKNWEDEVAFPFSIFLGRSKRLCSQSSSSVIRNKRREASCIDLTAEEETMFNLQLLYTNLHWSPFLCSWNFECGSLTWFPYESVVSKSLYREIQRQLLLSARFGTRYFVRLKFVLYYKFDLWLAGFFLSNQISSQSTNLIDVQPRKHTGGLALVSSSGRGCMGRHTSGSAAYFKRDVDHFYLF